MGMGAAPCHTQIVEQETIEKIVPNELKAFTEIAEKFDLLDDSTAMQCLGQGNIHEITEYGVSDATEEQLELVVTAYDALLTAFLEATDLPLSVNFISEDDGGRYDEVDNLFWEVGRVYQLTPVAKQFKEKFGDDAIKDVNYTIWC